MARAHGCARTWRPFIWDRCCHRPRATYPNGWAGNRPRVSPLAAPIRSCSRWGLPCRSCCQARGGLLPHPFTLATGLVDLWERRKPWRSAFCGTFPGVAPAGRYPAPCFRGARTFLPCSLSAFAGAAARPAGNAYKGIRTAKRNGKAARGPGRVDGRLPVRNRGAASPSSNSRPRPGSCAWRRGRHCTSGWCRRWFLHPACAPCRDISSRI